MGYYATTSDLAARFSGNEELAHLTDNPGGTVDDSVLDEVIDSSEQLEHSYIALLYATPVDVSSDSQLAAMLKGNTLDMAQYKLIARHKKIPEAIKELYAEALEWCQKVSEGKVILPAAAAPATACARIAVVRWGANDADEDTSERMFTREKQSSL
jgi:phage gp36-like protein